MAKVKKMGKENGYTEKIHGKKVKIGTGVGKRVGKKAGEAIKGRHAALKDLFPDEG